MQVFIILEENHGMGATVEKVFSNRNAARKFVIKDRFAGNDYYANFDEVTLNKYADEHIEDAFIED